MKLSHKQRVAQALVFYTLSDETVKEVAELFKVNAKSLQREYNSSYAGQYTY